LDGDIRDSLSTPSRHSSLISLYVPAEYQIRIGKMM
jgi:hypothetical protein